MTLRNRLRRSASRMESARRVRGGGRGPAARPGCRAVDAGPPPGRRRGARVRDAGAGRGVRAVLAEADRGQSPGLRGPDGPDGSPRGLRAVFAQPACLTPTLAGTYKQMTLWLSPA